jgi:DNA polymerase I-like protein with 3'-5' exonuclease and polymerase domains
LQLPPEPVVAGRRLLYDIETNGLLRELDRVHVLAIRDIDSRETFRFRHNDEEHSIPEGLKMLNEAGLIVGHNIIGFDNYALWKVYGDLFAPTGTMRDTLIMARMMFSDEKERDFRRWKRGELDGKLIGSHTLEAWGMRLGFPKDEYSARMKVRAAEWWEADPNWANDFKDLKAFTSWATWAEWSQEMEDYGCQDLDPTEALWRKIELVDWSEDATILEHMICDLMARVEQNGIYFDRDEAHLLEGLLREEHDTKADIAHEHFGTWLTAAKWHRDAPRPEFGEDDSRKMWGQVQIPKRSMKFKDPIAKGGDKTEGCAYCPIVLKDFNPNSRPMIIDRLKSIYLWEPQEFTEKNNPVVNDEVLRDLGHTIPICTELAEIFYYKKRLGQLADGAESWIGNCQPDGRIHPRINPGGTVTNRASHSKPNIAQVPRVVFKKLLQWMESDVVARKGIDGKLIYGRISADSSGREVFDQTGLTPMLDPDGVQFVGVPVVNKTTGEYDRDDEGKIKTRATLMKGRAGDHGWDCRRLFVSPPGWLLMGADQQGIELRALADAMWEFDNGVYAKLLLEADVHDAHQAALELDSRDTAKTWIYAFLYGAGDFKLGTIIDPTLANNVAACTALGAKSRERLMSRFPALKLLIKSVQKSARQGFVTALDGRRLMTRSKHAALNTLLQGMGATLAKIWAVSFESFMEEAGFVHGWNGDFVIVAWIHDELQICVRDDPRVMAAAERYVEEAATYAGERVGFRLPVEIGKPKFGRNWSETH